MNKKFRITSRQKQIIVGKILGDGHLETTNDITYRLKIEDSYAQKKYVDWLFTELRDLATAKPRCKHQIINGKIYTKYWFNTAHTVSLRFYGQQFYEMKKKIAPKLIHRWITPLSLAVWFMDDGSVKSRQCKGRYLNTQSFDHAGIHRLQRAIKNNFGIKTTTRRQKTGQQIYFPAGEIVKLKKVIAKYVLPCMKYKLG